MATIHRDIPLDATATEAWEALRDVGAAHTRLTPGVLVNCKLEGDKRTVTFANGMVASELIVAIDEGARRVAYSVQGAPFRHHHASMQIFEDGDGSKLVWITDLLPDDLVPQISALIDQGAAAMQKTMRRKRNAA